VHSSPTSGGPLALPESAPACAPPASRRASPRGRAPWLIGIAALLLALAACPGAQQRPSPQRRGPYDLALPTARGDFYSLEQARGKVLLVYFLATWCFPCNVEIPVLESLQRDFGPQGFQVVGVGMDLERRQVLEPFAESYGLGFPLLIADNEVRAGRSAFGEITQLPTTFVLDRQGKVAAAYTGPANPKGLRELVADLVE
jgi:peroxiredoxin